MRAIVVFASVLFFTGACSISFGGALLEERTETHILSLGSLLQIRNPNGNVTVEPWEGDQVQVVLSIYGNASAGIPSGFAIETESADESLEYRVSHPRTGSAVSVNFLVRVPRDLRLRLEVEVANGSISSSGPHSVDLRTVNGGITIEGASGGRGAETTNGNINASFTEIQDGMALRSVNGGVHAVLPEDAGFSAETVNGTVRIEGFSPDRSERTYASVSGAAVAELGTVNGNVTVKGD